MLANDPRIADLLVTERELVVGQANGSRIVRELGMFQGAGMQRDCPRLLTPGMSDTAVQSPQR